MTQILKSENVFMKISDVIAIPILAGQENTTDEMRKNFKILDKLEIADHEIILETDEYNRVKSKWQSFKWKIQHRDILMCEDELFGAIDVTP